MKNLQGIWFSIISLWYTNWHKRIRPLYWIYKILFYLHFFLFYSRVLYFVYIISVSHCLPVLAYVPSARHTIFRCFFRILFSVRFVTIIIRPLNIIRIDSQPMNFAISWYATVVGAVVRKLVICTRTSENGWIFNSNNIKQKKMQWKNVVRKNKKCTK